MRTQWVFYSEELYIDKNPLNEQKFQTGVIYCIRNSICKSSSSSTITNIIIISSSSSLWALSTADAPLNDSWAQISHTLIDNSHESIWTQQEMYIRLRPARLWRAVIVMRMIVCLHRTDMTPIQGFIYRADIKWSRARWLWHKRIVWNE